MGGGDRHTARAKGVEEAKRWRRSKGRAPLRLGAVATGGGGRRTTAMVVISAEHQRSNRPGLLCGISAEEDLCASPKLRLACIFNNFIKLLAARSGDVVRRLPRSRLPLPNPAAASLSAPAHPYTKINVFWNCDSKRCNFS